MAGKNELLSAVVQAPNISEVAVLAIKGIHTIDILLQLICIVGQGDKSSKVTISRIAIFDLKLGNLPVETINCLCFPTQKTRHHPRHGMVEEA
jgi:hypothetical protein